jgi:anthranilate phosphoribosyltransferase
LSRADLLGALAAGHAGGIEHGRALVAEALEPCGDASLLERALAAVDRRDAGAEELQGAVLEFLCRTKLSRQLPEDAMVISGVGSGETAMFPSLAAAAPVVAAAGLPVVLLGGRGVRGDAGALDLLWPRQPEAATRVADTVELAEPALAGSAMACLDPEDLWPGLCALRPLRRRAAAPGLIDMALALAWPAGSTAGLVEMIDVEFRIEVADVLLASRSRWGWLASYAAADGRVCDYARLTVFQRRDAARVRCTLTDWEAGAEAARQEAGAGAARQEDGEAAGAGTLRRILAGGAHPAAASVRMTAAAALWTAGRAASLEEGIEQAREAVACGAAGEVWQRWIRCMEAGTAPMPTAGQSDDERSRRG